MSGRFYDKRVWRDRLRRNQLEREPWCRIHKATTGMIVAATQVDHIKAISEGGDAYDPRNLQSLCDSCHSAKTRGDQGDHTRCWFDADGNPLNPAHHWNSGAAR